MPLSEPRGPFVTSIYLPAACYVAVRNVVCWLFPLLMLTFYYVAPAQAQQSIVEPSLEQQLDAYLNVSNPEHASEMLATIAAQVQPELHPSTYVRIRTYQAFELAQRGNMADGIAIVEDLREFTERFPYPDVVAEMQANLVVLYWYNNEPSHALLLAEQLITQLEVAENPRIRYYANNVMTSIYRANSQFEVALQRGLAALSALAETNDSRTEIRRISLTREITSIHADLKNYSEALVLVKRNIANAELIELFEEIPYLLLQQGFIESQMQRYDDSIATHRRAIDLSAQLGNTTVAMLSLNNIGSTYIELERYQEARATLQEAAQFAHLVTENDRVLSYLVAFNLGYIDVFEGNTEAGIARVESSYEQLVPLYTNAEKADLLEYLAKAYARAEMYQKQAEALMQQRELRAEIFNAEREKSLAELQNRYEAADRLQQIELLEQRNALQERVIENKRLQTQIFVLFAIVVIFGLILMIMLYRAARRANLRLKDANKQLEFHSLRDPLTALLNRRALQEKMAKRPSAERRANPQPYPDALLLLDIDYFKRINDKFGHAAGDVVLKAVSERLLTVSRASDMVIRWGGEEFLLYLHNMNPAALPEFTERVLHTIADGTVDFEGKSIQVTTTAGFVSLPFAGVAESELNWEKALQIADMALYIGKVHGRNRAYGITGLRQPFAEVRKYLDHDLAAAIENDLIEYVVIEGPKRSLN